jgi:outer membrane immunogenic protein
MKVRATFLTTAAPTLLAVMTPSNAADLRIKAAPVVVPPPVANWTGLYVGVSGGINWFKARSADRDALSERAALGDGTVTSEGSDGSSVGWLAGFTAGYNYQHGNFVVGVEGDYSWAGDKVSKTGIATHSFDEGDNIFIGNTVTTSELEALATIRARAGIDFSGTLAYVTGGVAFAQVKNSWSHTGYGPDVSASSDKWLTGIVLGGGFEHMFDRWTFKAEALWIKLEDVETNAPYQAEDKGSSPIRFKHDKVIGRVGLNYRF